MVASDVKTARQHSPLPNTSPLSLQLVNDSGGTSMNGGAIIAAVLARHGVKELFALCGGHISPILIGAEREGIRVVDVRDEKSAPLPQTRLADSVVYQESPR